MNLFGSQVEDPEARTWIEGSTVNHPIVQQIRVSLSGPNAWRLYRTTHTQATMILDMYPHATETSSAMILGANMMLRAISKTPEYADPAALEQQVHAAMQQVVDPEGYAYEETLDTGVMQKYLDTIFNQSHVAAESVNRLVTVMMDATRVGGYPLPVLKAYAMIWFDLCDTVLHTTPAPEN